MYEEINVVLKSYVSEFDMKLFYRVICTLRKTSTATVNKIKS